MVVACGTIDDISSSLGLSPEPDARYLASVRAKYRSVGREADTDAQLRAQLEQDGLIELGAAGPRPVSPKLPLSPREGMVAMLYADDHTADQIALVLGLSIETVRGYIARARLKYANADQHAPNKLQLRARLVEAGYLKD